MKTESIKIFTDGGCEPNPGPGAWAAVIQFGNRVVELGGVELETTNNKMELTAAIKAIEFLGSSSLETVIYSDSKYLIDGMNSWTKRWKKNGWKKTVNAQQLVANHQLWMQLDSFSNIIKWNHVPAHRGIPGNEKADEIVQRMMNRENFLLFDGLANDYQIDFDDLKVRHLKKSFQSFGQRNKVSDDIDALKWFLES